MNTQVFTYDGPTHLALKYAQMKKFNPFTEDQLRNTFPHKFPRPSKVKRSLGILVDNKFIVLTNKGYQITSQGYNYLRSIARKSQEFSHGNA